MGDSKEDRDVIRAANEARTAAVQVEACVDRLLTERPGDAAPREVLWRLLEIRETVVRTIGKLGGVDAPERIQ